MGTRLNGKVTLISGAAQGMGASHARSVVEHGGKVILGDILTAETADLADQLGETNAMAVPLDVRSTEAWTSAVEMGTERFGPSATSLSSWPATSLRSAPAPSLSPTVARSPVQNLTRATTAHAADFTYIC